MKNSKLLIVLLSALLVSLSYIATTDEYTVITDGECFTFKNRTGWINDDCFKTKIEAVKAMNEHAQSFLEDDKWETN